MEAAGRSKILMPVYETTWRHISEDSNPKIQDSETGPAYLGHLFTSLPFPLPLRC
jgi:hypothetical protein